MKQAERKRIINHLAQVNHPGLAGESIRGFVSNSHLKSDQEVISCIKAIKDQIIDAPGPMQRVLGNQFYFFKRLKIA